MPNIRTIYAAKWCGSSPTGITFLAKSWQIAVAMGVLLSGCVSNHDHPNSVASTTAPVDVVCPHCTMRHLVWDSHSRRTDETIHHDMWEMQCPDCVVRTAGVWMLMPSHTCSCCPAGTDRCPMCREADREHPGQPTTRIATSEHR